jgi:hypothetical protein
MVLCTICVFVSFFFPWWKLDCVAHVKRAGTGSGNATAHHPSYLFDFPGFFFVFLISSSPLFSFNRLLT